MQSQFHNVLVCIFYRSATVIAVPEVCWHNIHISVSLGVTCGQKLDIRTLLTDLKEDNATIYIWKITSHIGRVAIPSTGRKSA